MAPDSENRSVIHYDREIAAARHARLEEQRRKLAWPDPADFVDRSWHLKNGTWSGGTWTVGLWSISSSAFLGAVPATSRTTRKNEPTVHFVHLKDSHTTSGNMMYGSGQVRLARAVGPSPL
jgi:hypothetical protein